MLNVFFGAVELVVVVHAPTQSKLLVVGRELLQERVGLICVCKLPVRVDAARLLRTLLPVLNLHRLEPVTRSDR